MQYIEYDSKERIGFITVNRPDKRNALNFEVVKELKEAFTKASQDESVKVIVLRANGDAFCAGADLAYLQKLQQYSHEQNLDDSRHLKELFYQIYTLNKIVIAQVQGAALAGGCGLATVCDFTFASPEAKFGYTEVKIGFIPAIVMAFLIRRIGEAKSKLLLLTGNIIDAKEALDMGLIHFLVNKNSLDEEVVAFATKLIQSNSAQAMSTTKEMIAKMQSLTLDESLTFAIEMNAIARQTNDCKKGIDFFLRKEKINWS